MKQRKNNILARALVCLAILVLMLVGFYISLLASSSRLTIDQKSEVRQAASLLRERGFESESFLLQNMTSFRGSDNWLNASVAKEDAYAATNYPFEIMTLYSDFFAYPRDTVERAAILLHEAEHLKGRNEHDAYAFVWQNRARIGWTSDKYKDSPVWQNVRRQTRENAPELFNCQGRDFNDCTE